MDQEYGIDADFEAALSAADRSAAPTTSNTSHSDRSKVVQPKPQSLASRQGPSAILVSTRQKGNPILTHIHSLPWEYSDTPADYILGATTCALFLSLKYHRLHPEYIYNRIRGLGKMYNLRILLARVDVDNHEDSLKELSKTSMVNNLTLVLCWSEKEAARYLELFKSYEHAPPDSIKAHHRQSYRESLTDFITIPRSINKTDAASLLSNYGTLRAAINAPPEELTFIPGWGEKKVKDWNNAIREEFRVRKAIKTGVGLSRDNTIATGAVREGDVGSYSPRTPVPLSMIPNRESSGLGLSKKESASLPASKRRRVQETGLQGNPVQGDLVAASFEEENMASVPAAGNMANTDKNENREFMTEGVAAALAKLRETTG